MKKVLLPEQLSRLADNQSELIVNADDIYTLISELESKYNGFKQRLINDNGDLNKFVNFYINGEDIRFLSGMVTPLKDGDEISIIPALAGG